MKCIKLLFSTLLIPSFLQRKVQRARLRPPVRAGLPIPVLLVIVFIITFMAILPLAVFSCSLLPPSTAPASGAPSGLFSHLVNRLTPTSNSGVCLALRYSLYWPLVRNDLLVRQEQIIMRDLDEHRLFLGEHFLSFLRMKNRMPYRIELPPVQAASSSSSSEDMPSLWVVVLSASRVGRPASDRFDPRYLTQSLTALMQLSDDYAFRALGEKRFRTINVSACVVDESPSKNAEALRLSYYVDTWLLYRDEALDQLLTGESRARGSQSQPQDRSANAHINSSATRAPLEPELPAMRSFKRHLHLSAHRHEKPVAHADCRDKLLEDYARCLQNALDAVQKETRTSRQRPLLLLLHDDMIAGPELYEQILDLHYTRLPQLYGRNYAQKLGLVKLYSPRAQQRFVHMSIGEWLFFAVLICSLAIVFTVLTKLYCGRHRFSAVWRPTPQHALLFLVYVFYLSLLLFLLGRPAAIGIYQRLAPGSGPLLLESRSRSLSGCCHHSVLYTESGARQLAEYLSRALTVQDLARLSDDEHDAADPLSDARQPDHYAARLARFLADFSSHAPFHTLELLAPSALTHIGLYPTCGNRLVSIDLL